MPLTLKIHRTRGWDEVNEMFIPAIDKTVTMEHSLVSLKKWEQKYHVPFLHQKQLTEEQSIYYFWCMTTTQNVEPYLFRFLSREQVKEINDYISNPMSATTVNLQNKKHHQKQIQTAETIYGTMIDLEIPFECQKWHLNQLFKLIEVQVAKQEPAKKMSAKSAALQNSKLNAARRAKHHSRG